MMAGDAQPTKTTPTPTKSNKETAIIAARIRFNLVHYQYLELHLVIDDTHQ